MEYIVYVSTAKKLLNDAELLDILTQARYNNKLNNITGILLYSEGTFIQVLEGEHETLYGIYKIIEMDTRHKNIIKLSSGSIQNRNFPDWSMAFASVNVDTLKEFEGFADPTNLAFIGNDDHTSISMIKIFVESNNLN